MRYPALLPLLLALAFLAPVGVAAQTDAAPPIVPRLNVPIPGFTFTPPEGAENPLLAQYLGAVYRYGISITAIAATVMFVYGAFLYLVGSALPSISSGKRIMQEALLGMLLVFGAVMIVRTINPALQTLPSLRVDPIQAIAIENEDVVDDTVAARPNAPATAAVARGSFLGWDADELEGSEYIPAKPTDVRQPLEVPVFKQFIGPWAETAFGPAGVRACDGKNHDAFSVAQCCTTYHNAGCGAASLATLLAFNGVDTDPGKTGEVLVAAGARTCNMGTSFGKNTAQKIAPLTGDHTFTPLGGGMAGLRTAITTLRAGQPVMFLCQGCTGKNRSGGTKSYKGHYMVLTGVDDTGRILTVSDVGNNDDRGIVNISQGELAKRGAAFWALK